MSQVYATFYLGWAIEKAKSFCRSKIKCVNNGLGSKCKACTGNGIDYHYSSVSGSTPKQPEGTAKLKQGDSESPKRFRKVGDPLDAPVLTKKVWDEVFDIFTVHFSTQLPFLHPPTFRNRIRQASNPRDPSVAPIDLRDGGILLLALLMLTARFHSELVDYHSTAKSRNPLDASEYYATALKTAIGPTGFSLTSSSIDGIQALLMLALWEWGQTRDLSAWIYSGMAIRLAQAIGLPYEEDEENHRDTATEREVRRRTWWSCFIIDRMLSAGKYRPTMISVKQMKVKPPCFDDQFLFLRDETTNFWDEPTRADEIVNDDRVFGSYIRLVEIFGKFSEWSYAGGRKTETLPPWDSSTQFFKLRQELERFYHNLPSNLTFNKPNLSAHIENRNATTYASMHTLYSLCLIILYREYIPFIPLLRARPQGALDTPIFPGNQYHIPGEFWEESAVAIFTAARDIVDIVQTCQDNHALPESPQIEFAVSQAAFVCLYAAHFQHMDIGEYVHLRSGQSNDDNRTEGYMDLSVKILGNMIPRLNMAAGHLDMPGKMQNYLSSATTEFQQPVHQSWSALGSLKAYETFEKEFGSFHEMYESNPVCPRTSANDIGKESVNVDAMQGIEAAPKPVTISTSPTNENDDRRVSSSQGYQCNINHQQSPIQTTLSSFVSPGESTRGINLSDAQYAQHAQQQHLSAHLSANTHYLFPTVLGELRQEVNVTWSARQERTNASAYSNNAQLDHAETLFDGSPADMHNFEPLNYAQIHGLWNVPNTVVAGQGGFY
jgi:hypothetical protein